MTAAAPRTSLPVYERARETLQGLSGTAREHPMAALLALLIHRAEVPELGDAEAVGSGQLTDHARSVYAKRPPFDEGHGARAVMRRAGFGDVVVEQPGSNDWRNAFGSQKGIGCFAGEADLADLTFRHADRPTCPHRTEGADGDECALSPLAGDPAKRTPCRDVSEHAGEVPKLLRVVAASSSAYRYQLVRPDGPDLAKFLSGAPRVPLWPFLQAFYAGSDMRPGNAVITAEHFYDDLGITEADAVSLFDASPALPSNREIIRMTEPYLLASLRRRLFDLGFSIDFPDLINFYLSLKPRAFVILSGISGTGKSRLPRLFAELVLPPGSGPLANFELVPVRPGWNDVADLMGYYNSIHSGFEPGQALEAFRKADGAVDAHGRFGVFLLLDELNLSRVEHYFADFLSVMESRRLAGGSWVTDPLRLGGGRTGVLNFVGQHANAQPFVDCVAAELEIPDNLFLIGTVNIDESTQGISNKVLDRANTIELEDVNFDPPTPPMPDDYMAADLHLLGHHLFDRPYRTYAHALAAYPTEIAAIKDRLISLNQVLVDWRLHFGIRTRDEVSIYMAYAHDLCVTATAAGIDLEGFDPTSAFDRQVLQKILPRISGTREELQHGPQGNLFEKLEALLAPWGAAGSVAKLGRMKAQELANFWEA